MSLRARLAGAFALVALVTAAIVALSTPIIVGRGFSLLQTDGAAGPNPAGFGRGPGPGAGAHAQQVRDETILGLIVAAVAAAAGASVLGFVVASRISSPLKDLEQSATAIAGGDLSRRTGLAQRTDEVGSLGRSFDAMAGELERAEAVRRRLFQDAAHELRTPLTVIDATTTAVLDGVYAHEDRHLETIRDQSRLLARIVDDLRTISLAEAGQLPLDVEPVDVDRLLDDTIRAFAARADATGHRLSLEATPRLVVLADAGKLAQSLAAYVNNSIDHTPAGTDIVVEAGVPGPSLVRLAVRDTGPGIAADDASHLFDRFYRADPGRDRSDASSGLGLAIVRAFVEAQGGSVGVANITSGGARFWIDLPAAGVAGVE
jgi:signal transduction histidine kinase